MSKVSDYIVSYFLSHGIDTCFSVTGGGAMHLNDSFGHHPKIKNIYNHHEQGSSIAAEGYARISNKPAIVCVTSGPGATNAITGVFGAWTDSIPMIIISGQMKRETILSSTPIDLRYLGFQECNILELVKSITKYSAQITNLNYLKYHLDNALVEATTGRKGPVWLDIPIDIQGSQIQGTTFFGNLDIEERVNLNRIILNSNKLEIIFNELNLSKKPVLMIGEEVRWSGNADIVKKFYEWLKIPVVTEWNAQDLITNSHNLYCGRPGTIGDRSGNFIVQDADLLICIGCQLSIRQLSYEWKNFAKNAKTILINRDKNELDKPTIKPYLSVVADCGIFCKTFKKKYKKIPKFNKWLSWCKYIYNKYPIVTKKHYQKNSNINAYSAIDQLSVNATENTTFVLANGAACVVGLQAVIIKKNTRVFTNSGSSGMGYAIASCIGAAIASNKERKIVCIEGDGSIMMNIQELQTIVTNKLKVHIAIFNNGGYHSIRQTQKNIFDALKRGYCGASPKSGLGFPNFEIISKAFGIKYIRIENTNQLKSKTRAFLNSNKTVIAEYILDPNQDFEPKLISKLLKNGSFVTPSLEDMYPFLSKEEIEGNKFK